MDELTLDDKKYVSSKQAAKLTGYAKDYVGQLCREGRVQARLVGRSWYVLEASIKDHRFGNQSTPVGSEFVATSNRETEIESVKNDTKEIQHTLRETPIWTTSLYNKPHNDYSASQDESEIDAVETHQYRVDEAKDSRDLYGSPVSLDVFEVEESESRNDYYRDESELKETHSDILPWKIPHVDPQPTVRLKDEMRHAQKLSQRTKGGHLVATLRIALIFIALCSAALAYVNSGLADSFLTSANRASVITGIYTYK